VTVVSNSSPIMNLAVVGQVHALERLYGKVYIPEAVWQELSAIGTGQPWAAVMPTLSWPETRSVSHRSLARAYASTLLIPALGGGMSAGCTNFCENTPCPALIKARKLRAK
jgi:predicted nucleic acid-binding protein